MDNGRSVSTLSMLGAVTALVGLLVILRTDDLRLGLLMLFVGVASIGMGSQPEPPK
jgi:hypothetical protein